MRTTRRLVVNAYNPERDRIAVAAEILNAGGLVAFPTETVYGLGADGLNPEAVASIFTAKGRPPENPLILHVAGQAQVERLVAEVTDTAIVLMREFWPGALTLLLPRSSIVPDIVTAGRDLVGVRMPAHHVACELISEAGVPIAAPSANLSGGISPTTADHVYADLNGRIDLILDAGRTGLGLESTVLNITTYPPAVVRLGSVTLEQLTRVLGVEPVYAGEERPRLERYRGKARLILVTGKQERKAEAIRRLVDETDKGLNVAVLCTSELSLTGVFAGAVQVMGSHKNLQEIGSRLFELLRDLTVRMDVVIVEGVDEQGLGKVIMNRLRDAADELYEVDEI